jgi:hypothetical protein
MFAQHVPLLAARCRARLFDLRWILNLNDN